MKAALIIATCTISLSALLAGLFGLVWYAGQSVGLPVALLAGVASVGVLAMLTGELLHLAADAMGGVR